MNSGSAAAQSKKKYRVSEKQMSLDFTLKVMPKQTRDFSQVPNPIMLRFMRACNSAIAIRVLADISVRIFGGEFTTEAYGQKAAKLVGPIEKPGGGRDYRRPMWIPYTTANAMEAGCTDAEGARRAMALLEHELKVVVSRHAGTCDWYSIDLDRIKELDPVGKRVVTRPKPEETNIPNDAPAAPSVAELPVVRLPERNEEVPLAAACPHGDSCPLVAKTSEIPGFQNPQVIDSDKDMQNFGLKSGVESTFTKSLSELTSANSTTLVIKPGEKFPPLPLGLEVAGIRARDTQGSMISTSMVIFDLRQPAGSAASKSPVSRKLTLKDITQRLNNLTVIGSSGEAVTLRKHLAETAPPAVATKVHALIQDELAWTFLETQVRKRGLAIRSWALIPMLAEKAHAAHLEELADDRAGNSLAPSPPHKSAADLREDRKWAEVEKLQRKGMVPHATD